MGRRKIEIKRIENSIERKATFLRLRDDIFKKANALEKLCHVEVAVLVISPTNVPYTYGNPCFNDVVEHIQNPSASSKIVSLMKELECIRVLEEVWTKRQQRNREKSNMKGIVDLKLEDLVAFKGKLEAFQVGLKRKIVEMEDLSSPSMVSKVTKKRRQGPSFIPDRAGKCMSFGP
ncbi:Transcription factor MADS-box [Arabidopsis thaliana x Arabidopsis arenosa]|uniref:Transcription factor MADS-box n=1 Tax=Arabidopsis thaliana x Arabidopsis arenosa TaxID=1240361 RepID=A0A8T2C7Y5_9BRAS|nr:Transcription factor MADS-box [Arabidopsis thaliana x Arabidopsis arenosa]